MSIVGTSSHEIEILARLSNQRDFQFYLTGSRAGLNTVTQQSDWDFFVQDSREVRSWLDINGFKLHGESYEDDPQIACVYRYEFGEYHYTHIDVQCVLEFDKKLRIQEALKKSFALCGLTKTQARNIWRFAYELLK